MLNNWAAVVGLSSTAELVAEYFNAVGITPAVDTETGEFWNLDDPDCPETAVAWNIENDCPTEESDV